MFSRLPESAATPSDAAINSQQFVVAGEALVDIVVPAGGDPERAPGGSPLNVAVGLARLAVETVLVTELGDDELGALVRDHVLASGVILPEDTVVPGLATSTATAKLDASGAATYDFDLRWTLGPRTLPATATALHVGSIGAALRPGRESVMQLVREAHERGLLVTFDPNARPAFTPDAEAAWEDVLEAAAYAHLVKMSDEDLAFLRPGESAEDVARSLLGGSTELVVVTFGGEGASAWSKEAAVTVRSRASEVVDTVGAGDSFMAALLAIVVEHGLDELGEEHLEQVLHAAHEAASVTVSRRGANPPRRGELSAGWPGI
jgi:fructokinase